MQNSHSLLFSILVNSQSHQQLRSYFTKYIFNIQTQLVDSLNQIFNEQQVINSVLLKKTLVNIKHTQIILEFCPQSMQNEPKFKEIYVNLIKFLKIFNIKWMSNSGSNNFTLLSGTALRFFGNLFTFFSGTASLQNALIRLHWTSIIVKQTRMQRRREGEGG